MNVSEKLFFLVGLSFCFLGGLLLIGSLFNVLDPPPDQSASTYVVAGLLLGVLPFGIGLWLCRHTRRRARNRGRQTSERMILKLARENDGHLTVAEVALGTDLSSAQARQVLDRCHLERLADIDVSDEGVVTYTFPGIQRKGKMRTDER